jgi:glycosyltransferase involved in cell wall biosynthesis
LQEIIRHDVNGLLYPPGDVHALAAALDRLRKDAALRGRLGVEARAHMLKHHTWSAVVERILGIADACRYELRVMDPLPQAGPVSKIRKRLGNAT